MARRQRKDLYPTGDKIDVMERDVVAALIKPKFCAMDVAHFLVPEETVETLRKARALLYSRDGNNVYETYNCPLVLGDYGLVDTSIYINCAKLDTQAWKHDLVEPRLDLPFVPAILDTMKTIYRVCEDFDKVREVVAWFEDRKIAPGVVRYYWPTMGHFLSSDNPFHTVAMRDNDSIAGIGKIIPLLRETSGVVLSGALAPSHKSANATIRFGVNKLRLFDVV